MIRKPPAHIYRDTVTLRVCTGVDAWQAPEWQEYTISGVNLQASSDTRRTTANTEVTLRSLLFIDSVYTSPYVDIMALKERSESNGHQMSVVNGSDTYTVVTVDVLDNEFCVFDHAEVGLV